MNLAIIPARGGSKRIPHKNAKLFCGKPIIAYAIQNAIQSEIFDEVIVSTDSEEIATIAIQYGEKVYIVHLFAIFFTKLNKKIPFCYQLVFFTGFVLMFMKIKKFGALLLRDPSDPFNPFF